jgi:hypothetical protein
VEVGKKKKDESACSQQLLALVAASRIWCTERNDWARRCHAQLNSYNPIWLLLAWALCESIETDQGGGGCIKHVIYNITGG